MKLFGIQSGIYEGATLYMITSEVHSNKSLHSSQNIFTRDLIQKKAETF